MLHNVDTSKPMLGPGDLWGSPDDDDEPRRDDDLSGYDYMRMLFEEE